MGVDAYLKLARIADGQCFVPQDFITFTVHPDNPVAILPVYGAFFLEKHINLSTHFDEFDYLCKDPQRNLLAWGIFKHPKAGGIIVLERSKFEHYATHSKIEYIGAMNTEEHRKFWDTLTPGLWVVTQFSVTEIYDEDWGYNFYDLPKECQIIETREHNIWT